MPKLKMKPIEIVYLGQRIDNKGKLYSAIVPLAICENPANAHLNSSHFDSKNFSFAVAGGIYLVDGTLGPDGRINSISTSGLGFPAGGWKVFDDEGAVAGWQATEKAARVEKAARALATKEKRDGSLSEIMLPLKQKYAKTNPIGKLALEVVILAELRRKII